MSSSRRDHPDMRDDAPGRIPESLIDAAIDGELDPEIQKVIGSALQYDPARRQEFHDTRDAINALRMPIESPDLSDRVLERAHRHRRFIPGTLRRHVRAGRVGISALLLVTLFGVAALQRAYPRLTTIAAQPTPVSNVESAIEQDGRQLAQTVTDDIQSFRECVEPVRGILAGSLQRPGVSGYNTETRVVTAGLSSPHQSGLSADQFSHHRAAYALMSLAQARSEQSNETRAYGFASRSRAASVIVVSWTNSIEPAEPRSPGTIEDPLELP